ncbi:MAG: TlpA family protein disulfide reductase [Acidobacteria bacterium]|nr:TlpA family protein disulfide reductase [Acidobacteriota bacterium]
MQSLLVLPLIAALSLTAASQTSHLFTGTVLDQNGQPQAGVDIASFWLGGVKDQSGFRPYNAATSDEQGTFTLSPKELRSPMTVLALDSERRRGAVVTIDDIRAGKKTIVTLRPLHRVRYIFQGPGLTDLSQSRITLETPRGMFSQISGPRENTISLPSGQYTFRIAVVEGSPQEVHFEVANRDLTLKPIDLVGGIAQHYGRPAPPLSAVLAVNSDSFNAETLRNKWVLLYFWGYWCASCVNEGLPKLARFYKENRKRFANFEILAIHENGVGGNITVGELRQKLARLADDKWSGTLPFPVLLDRSGEIIKTWGIVAFPTVALINPEGNVVEGDIERLRRALTPN